MAESPGGAPCESFAHTGWREPATESNYRFRPGGGLLPVQEKLNGVWVLWDGQRLWTKQGNPVRVPDTFRTFLPPSFAVVGELFLGYGHRPFQYANTLARGGLPKLWNLPEGTVSAEARKQIWQHARIVAFDAPGLAWDRRCPTAGPTVPYEERYHVLQLLVGAWSKRKRTVPVTLLPLQLIRQYPLTSLGAMFQEVVEGQVVCPGASPDGDTVE